MKSLKFPLVTLVLSLIGCVSTPNKESRFEEPMRTMNFVGCLRAQLPVTACICIEKEMFRRFGNAESAAKNGYSKKEVIVPVAQECLKEVIPEMSKNQGEDM